MDYISSVMKAISALCEDILDFPIYHACQMLLEPCIFKYVGI